MVTVEPGIYRRVDLRTGRVLPLLWISYTVNRRLYREGTGTTSIVAARKLRARRLVEMGRGEPGKAAEKILVGELLDAYEVNAKLNGYSSVRTSRGHLKRLRSAFGQWRAVDLTTDVIERHQLLWREAGLSNATINRVCNTLRRAFTLARRARKIYVIPFIPRLAESGKRGKYIGAGDFEAILKGTPMYLHPFLRFAYAHGTRKGQLARTQRRFVDLERGVIVWPPSECKHRESHVVPLEGEALTIVQALMEAPPLWCPYLFHGRHCAPGRTVSKSYGCVGDIKKAWATACKKAGFPVGRKAGGFVFHHTRNSAATNLRAGGMDEADAMKISGHTTTHVFRHYDIGDVEALRERLARAREQKRSRSTTSVTPIRAQS